MTPLEGVELKHSKGNAVELDEYGMMRIAS